jgi:hypothetical protein
MSGVGFRAVTGEIATGTSAKTLLQVVAAANHRVLIKEISADAGTMSALTPVKSDDSADETLQVTAQHTSTGEPSSGDVLMTEEVHPQTGFVWQAPFGGEIPVGGGDRIAVRVTAGNDVSSISRMVGEE